MNRIYSLPALVLSLGLSAPVCLAAGHGGGGGHMGGGHMGGGHMGGGHMGGGHMGGGHMGGSSFGGSHFGGGGVHTGGGRGGSFNPGIGSSHHGGSGFSGGSVRPQVFQPGSSGNNIHGGSGFNHGGNFSSGGSRGIQNGGLGGGSHLQHGGNISSGVLNQHHFQNHGAGTTGHPVIHGGAGNVAGGAGQHQHGFQHTAAKFNQHNAIGQQQFGGNRQNAHQFLSSQPHGISARQTSLQNNLGHFHHGGHGPGGMNGHGPGAGQGGVHQGGHGHGNWNGNGHGNWNGNGHGNWNGHRQDWMGYHHRHYYPYYGWYTGFWNPGFGFGFGNNFGYGYGYGYGYGGYGYGGIYNAYPGWGAFGLTPWGINQQAWNFGYWNYSNPYCYSTDAAPYNYSQPLVVIQQSPAVQTDNAADPNLETLPPGVTQAGKQAFDQGLAAFKAGDSNQALDLVNQAIQQMPGDAVAHEFRSLVLFSQGRYDEAAESIYAVLSVGPGWDWQTMIGLYGNPQDYTTQLRALESYISQHLDSSAARFLLAYHYMRCNHNDTAAVQLKRVLELTPGNKVATDLLSVIEGPDAVKNIPGATEPVLPPPPDKDVATVDLKTEQLFGIWTATGPDGTTFRVELNPDSTFKWTFTRQGKSEDVVGVWAVKEGTLALEPNAGGNMLGNVVMNGDQKFNFRMTGTVSNDPGLNFEKTTAQ